METGVHIGMYHHPPPPPPRFAEYRRHNPWAIMHPRNRITAGSPLEVENMIEEARGGKSYRQRSPGKIDHIVIHRIGAELGVLPEQIIKSFQDTRKYAAGYYTGGVVPYCLYVDPWGTVTQLLEVSDVAPHARRWNYVGIGIAVSGDFRRHYPTWEQHNSLGRLCSALGYWIGPDYQISGHTELPGATSVEGKECPGELMNLDDLRRGVRSHIARWKELQLAPESRDMALKASGIVV